MPLKPETEDDRFGMGDGHIVAVRWIQSTPWHSLSRSLKETAFVLEDGDYTLFRGYGYTTEESVLDLYRAGRDWHGAS